MGWIFEGAVKWISEMITELLDMFSGAFTKTFGMDMTTFTVYFPFAISAWEIILALGAAIMMLIFVWQTFRAMAGPLADAENPGILLVRTGLFAFLMANAAKIMRYVLAIGAGPYGELLDIESTVEEFTFTGLNGALEAGLFGIGASLSTTATIMLLILVITIAINYFKLLLEIVERYIVLGVLIFTSPLAIALGPSKVTNPSFRSWCRMFGSQMVLMIMNVWFLRGFNVAFGAFATHAGKTDDGRGSCLLWFFAMLAYLKAAQRIDSHMAAIGLNTAQTGSGMFAELMIAGKMLAGGIGTGAGGARHGAGAHFGPGPVTPSPAGSFAARFSPGSALADAASGGTTRLAPGGISGMVARSFGAVAAKAGAVMGADTVSRVASMPPGTPGSIGGSVADASLKNYIPAVAGKTLSGTEISGGVITTKATDEQGKVADVALHSAAAFEAPDGGFRSVRASDGSEWYMQASGDGAAAFFPTPAFDADASARDAAEAFPTLPAGTALETTGSGCIAAQLPDGRSSMIYDGALYEPGEGMTVVPGPCGSSWYMTQPAAPVPDNGPIPTAYGGTVLPSDFPAVAAGSTFTDMGSGRLAVSAPDGSASILYDAGIHAAPAGSSVMTGPEGSSWYMTRPVMPLGASRPAGGSQAPEFLEASGEEISGYFPSLAQGCMLNSVDGGRIDVTFPDGSSSVLYDGAVYAQPPASSLVRGFDGSTWYMSDPVVSAAAGAAAGFDDFMPDTGLNVSRVDFSSPGMIRAYAADGGGAAFFDPAVYDVPRGDYTVSRDKNGNDWYRIEAEEVVRTVPVIRDGGPVPGNGGVKTRTVAETRYPGMPKAFEPARKRNPARKLKELKPKRK